MYEKMRTIFASSCHNWHEINLQTSFRSYQKILDVVDAVFANSSGLGAKKIKHTAFHEGDGELQLLPLIQPIKHEYNEWPIFTENVVDIATEDMLAEQVINYLTANNCNDVMILMRRRGRLMKALEKQAKAKKITCFANHSFNLLDKLIVQDLLSIVEFILMPLNELNLAGLLKTDFMQKIAPISEELLFDLCYKREKNLWQIVQEKLPQHAEILQQLLAKNTGDSYSYFLKAYEILASNDYYLNHFMEEVFKRINYLDLGIRALIDHLHRFPPSLNQTASNGDEQLKIMTVHGAKGMEAKTVVIIDDGDKPSLKQEVCLFDPVLGFWFLKPTQQADTILTAALKEYQQNQMEHEYERLLYVALTRAREHLVLAGIAHEPHQHSWYFRVHDAIANN
jgi:ATP-dependent helicase/nuclease subunit A